jgi:hypothetical protein
MVCLGQEPHGSLLNPHVCALCLLVSVYLYASMILVGIVFNCCDYALFISNFGKYCYRCVIQLLLM